LQAHSEDRPLVFPPETAGIRRADWKVARQEPGRRHTELRLRGLNGYADARERAAVLGVEGVDAAIVVEVDTVFCALEVEEILYELRAYPVSLEGNPAGYLLSMILQFSDRPEYVLPDRADITGRTPCIRAYFRHLADVAARRGAGIRGEQVPAEDFPLEGNRPVEAADMLQVPRGRITEGGLRENIRICLEFLAGDASIESVDAALACAQLWQSVRYDTGVLDTGRIVTEELFERLLEEERRKLADAVQGPAVETARLGEAAAMLAVSVCADTLPQLPATRTYAET
jgi:malate synthase